MTLESFQYILTTNEETNLERIGLALYNLIGNRKIIGKAAVSVLVVIFPPLMPNKPKIPLLAAIRHGILRVGLSVNRHSIFTVNKQIFTQKDNIKEGEPNFFGNKIISGQATLERIMNILRGLRIMDKIATVRLMSTKFEETEKPIVKNF